VVDYLYDAGRDAAGERECVLARFYATQSSDQLPPDLRAFAQAIGAPEPLLPETQCLTLLASRGIEAEWNDRAASRSHRAIPLPSAGIVERAPMIAQLIRAMGVPVEHLVARERELMRGMEGKTYDVFFVPEAEGSPFIPAQDFVRRSGVRSVIGFGGVLTSGDLFAVIVFARVRIPRESTVRFRNVALDVKLAITEAARVGVFAPTASGR
jgi:hypothetical protein